ncbi:hypothetical protein G5C60_48700 [Streptomyces sp. HC44]|uniref:Uncharacterized protein n=1 Tax=Streptomyces scabichelini TaxID=2711217 RepID=A0A6G4VM66_9ACTN|nr:hypothetical protein [Streptomyces scabichelini]NGO15262.1 hypothetical protein [Streptomyces scabichelini]
MTAVWVAVGTGAGSLGAWQLASADGDGGAHGRALDDAAVRRALAEGTRSAPSTLGSGSAPSSDSPGATTAPRPSRSPRTDTVHFAGGSATAECRADGSVFLVSWSPADGYQFDEDVARGPAPVARLEAEPIADDADDLAYDVTCVADGPKAQRVPGADD